MITGNLLISMEIDTLALAHCVLAPLPCIASPLPASLPVCHLLAELGSGRSLMVLQWELFSKPCPVLVVLRHTWLCTAAMAVNNISVAVVLKCS